MSQRAALLQVIGAAFLLFLLTRKKVWAWVVLLPPRLLYRMTLGRKR